jgi:hypothetical protein
VSGDTIFLVFDSSFCIYLLQKTKNIETTNVKAVKTSKPKQKNQAKTKQKQNQAKTKQKPSETHKKSKVKCIQNPQIAFPIRFSKRKNKESWKWGKKIYRWIEKITAVRMVPKISNLIEYQSNGGRKQPKTEKSTGNQKKTMKKQKKKTHKQTQKHIKKRKLESKNEKKHTKNE